MNHLEGGSLAGPVAGIAEYCVANYWRVEAVGSAGPCSRPGQLAVGAEQGQSGPGPLLRPAGSVGPPAEGVDEGLQRLREICHDIRQPVAAVQALAAAALGDPGLPGVTHSYLEQIITQTQTLADVIRQRLHADGAPEASARLTDLGSLADEAAAAERVTYEGTLEVEPHAEPVLVCVNQVEVRGIISNLLSNATRAAGPAGTVTIEISHDLGLAQLVVEDTGPGFGEIPGGTGLGWRSIARSLAICRGKISYGRGPLGGVRASLWLPLAAA
jgi:signal transduction histidine kinase